MQVAKDGISFIEKLYELEMENAILKSSLDDSKQTIAKLTQGKRNSKMLIGQ